MKSFIYRERHPPELFISLLNDTDWTPETCPVLTMSYPHPVSPDHEILSRKLREEKTKINSFFRPRLFFTHFLFPSLQLRQRNMCAQRSTSTKKMFVFNFQYSSTSLLDTKESARWQTRSLKLICASSLAMSAPSRHHRIASQAAMLRGTSACLAQRSIM